MQGKGTYPWRPRGDVEPDRAGHRRGRTRFGPWSPGGVAALALGVPILAWLAEPDPPRDGARMRIVGGGSEDVTVALAASPGGTEVATVAPAGHIAIRSAATGFAPERRLRFEGHARVVAYSPDGRSLAAGGDEPGIVVFDLDRVARARAVPLAIDGINALAFSPDSRTLAIATDRDGSILLCDPTSGRLKAAWKDPSPVRTLAFSPGGGSLASGGAVDRPTVIVRGVALGEDRIRWSDRDGAIVAMAFSPDGTRLATAAAFERCVRIRDASTAEAHRIIEGHPSGTNALAFSPDGRSLATAGNDGMVRLWSVATGRPEAVLEGGAPGMRHVAFAAGRWLVATSWNDNALRVYPLAEPR